MVTIRTSDLHMLYVCWRLQTMCYGFYKSVEREVCPLKKFLFLLIMKVVLSQHLVIRCTTTTASYILSKT